MSAILTFATWGGSAYLCMWIAKRKRRNKILWLILGILVPPLTFAIFNILSLLLTVAAIAFLPPI